MKLVELFFSQIPLKTLPIARDLVWPQIGSLLLVLRKKSFSDANLGLKHLWLGIFIEPVFLFNLREQTFNAKKFPNNISMVSVKFRALNP